MEKYFVIPIDNRLNGHKLILVKQGSGPEWRIGEMAKASLQQQLLGKKLTENPMTVSYNENGRFQYWGLTGPSVTIQAAWLEGASVKVLVSDSTGKMAEVYASLFLIEQ